MRDFVVLDPPPSPTFFSFLFCLLIDYEKAKKEKRNQESIFRFRYYFVSFFCVNYTTYIHTRTDTHTQTNRIHHRKK